MSKILVVDDKEMMRDSVAATLSRRGHVVSAAPGGKSAIEKVAQKRFDAVITDLQMPEMDGLELLGEIRAIDDQLPVIFMTAYGTVETAVAAMKKGAYDYITKPFSGDELIVAVDRAVEHRALVKENQILRAASPSATAAGRHEFVGSGAVMGDLKEQLARIADSHGTVLITGESGSGKEVAARRIHAMSPRADQPFLAINCAALSTSLLESELFGHERGAFTGADRLRKGRFELADGGTLLLDEISEIAPSVQAKLLRVLQEQSFERVGSSRSLAVDVRVIATTNRDLPAEAARGSFRQDLFYRLNVLPIALPALRRRPEDLPELVDHFLRQIADREGRPRATIEAGVLELFARYEWPGNVRELQNICERAAVLTVGGTITASMIAPWLGGGLPAVPVAAAGPGASATIEAKPDGSIAPAIVCKGEFTLDDIEREAIVATLEHHNGHRQKSAKALGIGVRTLGLKLKKWKEQRLVAQGL
ncbi:MAG: sigma-54-dependent Fis family transcriptional regulator [Planctomycetes bacterium]|nr:sigma-54-dependent Fis family transcriptional regulator [Planctomycetota bacterium]